jgi:hypothetical protein
MRFCRYVKRLLMVCALLAVLLLGFFWHYQRHAEAMMAQHQFSGFQANAMKHALAAGQIYHVLQTIMPVRQAERTVIGLGIAYERVEQYLHWRVVDSPEEVARDMINNWSGIAAAQWQLQDASRRKTPLRERIFYLASSHTLSVDPAQIALLPMQREEVGQQAVDVGIAFANAERARIPAQVNAALDAMPAPQVVDN